MIYSVAYRFRHFLLLINFFLLTNCFAPPPEGRPHEPGRGRPENHGTPHGQPHDPAHTGSGSTAFLETPRRVAEKTHFFLGLATLQYPNGVTEVTLVRVPPSEYSRYPLGFYIEFKTPRGDLRTTAEQTQSFLTQSRGLDVRLLPARTVLQRFPGSDSPLNARGRTPSPRHLVIAVATHLQESTTLPEEIRNHPILRRYLGDPDLVRSIQFDKIAGEVTLVVYHAAYRGGIQIRGAEAVGAVLRSAGFTAPPDAFYHMTPAFYFSAPNLSAISLGDRTHSEQVRSLAHSRHADSAANSPDHAHTTATTIRINPTTGLPSPQGVIVAINVQTKGVEATPHSETWTLSANDDQISRLGPSQQAAFHFFLATMNREASDLPSTPSTAFPPRVGPDNARPVTAVTMREAASVAEAWAMGNQIRPESIHEIALVSEGNNSHIEIRYYRNTGDLPETVTTRVGEAAFERYLTHARRANPDFSIDRIPGRHVVYRDQAGTFREPARARLMAQTDRLITEIARLVPQIPEVRELIRGNTALLQHFEAETLLRSIQFVRGADDAVEIRIRHALVPDQTLTISGIVTIHEMLKRAGVANFPISALPSVIPTLQVSTGRLVSRMVGNSRLTADLLQAAGANHRAMVNTPGFQMPANGFYTSQYSTTILINPRTGQPDASGTPVRITCTMGGTSEFPQARSNWAVDTSDPTYREFSRPVKYLFDAYLEGLGR